MQLPTDRADRPVFVLVGSALAGLALLRLGPTPGLILGAALAVVTAPLFATDVRVQRLPNALVLPLYPVAVSALLLSTHPLPALLLGAATLVGFALLNLIGGLGMGDVKLAGPLAVSLGLLGPATAAVGLVLPFLLGGACALILLLSGRRGDIPFGPFLFAGYWLAVAVVR